MERHLSASVIEQEETEQEQEQEQGPVLGGDEERPESTILVRMYASYLVLGWDVGLLVVFVCVCVLGVCGLPLSLPRVPTWLHCPFSFSHSLLSFPPILFF